MPFRKISDRNCNSKISPFRNSEGFFYLWYTRKTNMLYRFFVFVLMLFSVSGFAQKPGEDYTWWNELHGWQDGDPGWRNWIRITPGYLGPNALPVPEVKRGYLNYKSEFEITASGHFLKGDPTQDISARLFVPFAQSKIAVEFYGVMVEHFSFSEEIRNERYARIEDGKGFAFGD